MRVSKNIVVKCNLDSPPELEFTLEYDNYSFDGSFEEVLEQFEGMLSAFEYKSKKEKQDGM